MKKLMIAAVAALAINSALAWSPIGIGIAAPAQLPLMSDNVYGLRLGGLFGYNEEVIGVDLGLAEVTTGNAYALQVGAVNVVHGEAAGLQVGAISYNEHTFAGVQVSPLGSWNGLDAYGLQFALVNADQTAFGGFAFGGINYAAKMTGAQFGVLNFADSMTGLQIGGINVCDKAEGIQIGLINMITTSPLPVMVVANVWF